MCFQHEQHRKELEARFKDGSLESLNSFSETKQYSEDLAYRESYNKLTASLAPVDTYMFKCVVRHSKILDSSSVSEVDKGN